MFKELLKCLAKRLSQVQTLGSHKINWIRNVDETGIYIETEQSRKKFKEGEKAEPFEILGFDYLEKGFQEFSSKRIATANDFVNTRGRTSFIMAFFAELPFVEVQSSLPVTIAIKEFATDDLPSEQYHKVKVFLEEVLSGRFDPALLSEQAEGNLYRVKTRGRQDARLLGLVDHNNQVNRELFQKYKAATDKDTFLQRLILRHDYFRLALTCLDLIRDLSKKDKKRVLEELGKLIVRSSRGENLMVDSVAKERTHNLLRWLESTQLVDANWSPTEKYYNKDGGADSMGTGLRESLLKIMREYGVAKTEGFAGHPLGTFVRNEVPKEIKKLGVLPQEGYIVTGSVGQGNWAAVPWIAIVNSKITTSTQRGYYIGYLFSEDMERLYLTLAQGVTETTKEEMIRIKADIRANISMPERIKKDDEMDMGSGPRAKQYALSTAAYIPYTYTDMPSEKILVSDLEDMIRVYESYIAFKEEITSSDRKFSQSVLEDQMSLLDS